MDDSLQLHCAAIAWVLEWKIDKNTYTIISLLLDSHCSFSAARVGNMNWISSPTASVSLSRFVYSAISTFQSSDLRLFFALSYKTVQS